MRAQRHWLVAAAVTLVVATVQMTALADRSRGEPANGGIRQYVLGEITDGLRVGQQFLVKADGLSSVTIHPRPTGSDPRGSATLELLDVTGEADGSEEGTVVARASVPLGELVRMDAYTLAFAPQRSWYRTYRLVVTVTGAGRDQGFGLLAVRGDGYRDAALRVNRAAKRGDLVFETSVAGARSNFAVLSSRLGAAGIPAPGGAFAALLAAQYAALFLVLRLFLPGSPYVE